MGMTNDLFWKIRDTKGPFHAKVGTIKDRNCMDLTEAENIKRRQEYPELYQKGLNDLDHYYGVITHLESDILECEVKLLQPRVPGNKLTQKDNADSGVQFITLAGPRQSLLLSKDPNQHL